MSTGTPATDRSPTAPHVVFELSGISKRYGATQALDDVTVQVRAGEFVALLGPNGAGKSTLIKVLDGVEQQDSGAVRVAEEAGGLGIVHQDLGLVGTMTVTENMFLGRSRGRLRLTTEVAEAREALAAVGLPAIDPHQLVDDLTLGERTMVAVAKLLSRGDRVIVIDEVTAGLPATEADWLVEHLKSATRLGATVMMVTHRIREVSGAADRYVVMLDGRVAVDASSADTTESDLIRVMSAGHHVSSTAAVAARSGDEQATVVCRLVAAEYESAGPVDVELIAGRIIGVTGLIGCGLHEVAYMAAGLLKPTAGTVEVPRGTRRRCVPAHRESEGVFPEDTEEFNLTAGVWRRWRSPAGLLWVGALRADAKETALRLRLSPPDLEMQVGRLSGGNQQKTVLGRAMIDEPQLLVLCEPTRGVDVGTRQEIYAQVRAAAARGAAVFVASSDIEDLGSLAETIGVMGADGTILRWVDNTESIDLSLLATEFI